MSEDLKTAFEQMAETTTRKYSHYTFSVDVIAIIIFFVVALSVFYARGGFRPKVVDLTSDAANIATMAAASDIPERFQADSVFRSAEASKFYVAFHVPLTSLLNRFVHDYGRAFTLILLPTVFLYLLAFYFLGVQWFGNRVAAIGLAFVNLVLVKGPRDTAWGPFKDAIPRFDHAVLFALLIGLLWRWRYRPALWPLVFACAGLGVYVHPVSTPALGAMLLGASLAITLANGRNKYNLFMIFVGGIVYLMMILPFAIPFVSEAAFGRTPTPMLRVEEKCELVQIIEERFAGYYLSPSKTILEYFSRPHMAFGIIPGLIGGVTLMSLSQERDARGKLLFLLGGLCGLLTAAALLPTVVECATQPWELAVFKGELPRPMRYLVPLSYLSLLTGLTSLWNQANRKWRYRVTGVAAVIVFVCLVETLPRAVRAVKASLGVSDRTTPILEIVSAVEKHCHTKHSIAAAMTDPLVIRYSALRPLAFARKDVPSLQSLAKTQQWQKNAERLKDILGTTDAAARVAKACTWAEELNAGYTVIELPDHSPVTRIEIPSGWSCIFQNHRFLLLKSRLVSEKP